MTTEITDAGTDTPTDTGRARRLARAALIAPACIVGTASFVESFHGLYDLLRRVGAANPVLAAVGPIGVDGLQLVSLVGTVIARRAPWHTRAYMWTALLGATAVSVTGNAVDASARHLTDAGLWISGLWPVLLAAASHIVVVSSRLLEERPARATQEPTVAELAEPGADTGEESAPVSAPTEAQLRARARSRYQRGTSCRAIAVDLQAQGFGVSEKKVERWTADLRAARRTGTADEPADTEPVPAT